MTSSADDAYRHDVPDSGTACAYCCPAGGVADARVSDGPAPGWLAHLYTCQGLSTYQIAACTGVDRQRVTRALRKAGVPLRSRGAGRLRPVRRTGEPPDLPRLLRELYEEARLGSRQIAAITGR